MMIEAIELESVFFLFNVHNFGNALYYYKKSIPILISFSISMSSYGED